MSLNNYRKKALALFATMAFSIITSYAHGDATTGAVAMSAWQSSSFSNLVASEDAFNEWNETNLTRTVPSVSFDNLPVTEVVKAMKSMYPNLFDVIMPTDPDPSTISVNIELKNVNALEIFNAMDLAFETGKIPAHWKLILNGTRPTAVFEIDQPKAPAPPPEAVKMIHSVFSIVNILDVPEGLGDGDARQKERDLRSARVIEELAQVLRDIEKTPPDPDKIHIHSGAAIVVFTGTAEETQLIRSTLDALRYEVESNQEKQVRDAEAARKAKEALKK